MTQPTRWSLIDAVVAGERRAQEEFVSRYRPLVERFLERRVGRDAEDVAQDVFVRLMAEGALKRVGPEKGSFRSYLFAVTRNVLGDYLDRRQAKKRGGDEQIVPLGSGQHPALEGAQEAFDREWLLRLLELAMDRLQREHPRYFEAVRGFLWEGQPQADVAAQLDRSVQDVRNHVHRGRQKLIAYVREEVARCEASPQQHQTELEVLAKLMTKGRGSP